MHRFPCMARMRPLGGRARRCSAPEERLKDSGWIAARGSAESGRPGASAACGLCAACEQQRLESHLAAESERA